jgi:hypothetical protein
LPNANVKVIQPVEIDRPWRPAPHTRPWINCDGYGDVVDFYGTGTRAYFISDDLFRLIEDVDPGSLEHVGFKVRAKDAELPFHAIMPSRIVEAIDTRRTTVAIKDEDYAGWFFRAVRFSRRHSLQQRRSRRSRFLFRLRRARLVLVEGPARTGASARNPGTLRAIRSFVPGA